MNGGHVWRRLPSSALDALAQALEAGRIALPPLPSVLERYVGRDQADAAASELAALLGEAFTGAQMARLLRAVAFDGPVPARLELVWSGPEPAQSSTRDTGVVVPELFASTKRSVVVAGFAIRQGDSVFAPLATNMDSNPALDVRIFTNIQRAWKDTLADAWRDGKTDALSIAVALSKKVGKALPWTTVREALDAAFRARLLDRAAGGTDWPCDYSRASGVSIAMPQAGAAPGPAAPPTDTRASAEVPLKPNQLQDFVDVLPDILKATAGSEMSFRLTVEIKGKDRPSDRTVATINKLLESVAPGLRVQ